MAEPSSSVGKTEIDQHIAFFLGYSRTSASWDTLQTANVNAARDYGVHRFYSETDWNFMSPFTTITTTINDYDQALPDDFGSMRGDAFTYASSLGYAPITMTSVGRINEMRTAGTSSGIITHAAISPITQDGSAGQRWQVLWHNPPSAAFVLTYRYNVNRDALSASYPYHAGGNVMRNCVLEACLAAAESLVRNEIGMHEALYQQSLSLAKDADGRTAARNLGYNGDSKSYNRPFRYNYYNGGLGT